MADGPSSTIVVNGDTTGADAAFQKVEKATNRFREQLIRLNRELESGGRNTTKFVEESAKAAGANVEALRPLLDANAKLRAQQALTNSQFTKGGQALSEYGLSAKATTAALRQVPAQLTDIVVSLQGGQKPLTVLLQQGGQLKDVFGGVGNAFKALSGFIIGLINPFTVGAAAVAGFGLALASINGRDSELLELSARLTGTGRASVAAVGDIRALVLELNKVSGISKDSATAILGEFAKVSGLGGAMFRGLGASVADFAAATGTDLPSAARKLAAAFGDPAKGAKDLETTLGTLTAAQILTIEKMTALGDKAGAQTALMEALKIATQGLADQAMTPLGQATEKLSNSWDGLTTAVSKSDAFRAANDGLASLITKTAKLAEELSRIKPPDFLKNFSPFGLATGGAIGVIGDLMGGGAPKNRGATGTFNTGGASGSFAPSESEIEQQVKAALTATASFTSQSGAMDKLKDTAKQARAALKELETQNKGTGIEAVTLRDRISGINEKLVEMAKRGNKGLSDAAKGLNLYNDLIAVSTGLSANFTEQWELLSAKFVKDGNMDQLLQGQAALLAKQPFMVDSLKAEAKAIEVTEKARKSSLLSHVKELESINNKAQKLEDELALYGMSKAAIEELTTARMRDRIEVLEGFDNSAEAIAIINEEIDARKRLAIAGTALDRKDADKKAAKDEAREISKFADELHDDIKNSLSAAFRDTKNSIKAFGDALANTVFTRVSSSLADALVKGALSSSFGTGLLGILGFGGGAAGGGSAAAALAGGTAPLASGGAFDKGGAKTFANGEAFHNSVLTQATPFKFASGGGFNQGVAGEAGPEAVMPLTRAADGRLGVQSSGEAKTVQNVVVNYNMTVGDVASVSMVRQAVAGSERRIAAGIGRSLSYGGALS